MDFIGRVIAATATAFVALTCCIATASPANADPAFGSAVWGGVNNNICATPEGSFNFLNGDPCLYAIAQPPLAAAGSLNDPGGSTSAQASLALGSVSVTVAGDNGGGGFGHALIWDTLTFAGAAPGAVATIVMTGTASAQGNATTSAAAVLFDLSQTGPIGSVFSLLEGNNFSSVGNGSYDLQAVFGISNNVPMLFAIGVDASAGSTFVNVVEPDGSIVTEWYSASASISDPFSLELPAGVTFTAASGGFPSAIPEPATLLVMLCGLARLGWSRRQHRG